jgi:hypothetical protein
MDQSETWAKDYLIYRGFKSDDVLFEPDGNVPPDFLVEGRIAVEVRRLNQHWESASGDLQPMEELSIPLLIRLRKLLHSFGPPTNGVSWYVIHRFGRPQLTKDWEPILRAELEPFQKGEIEDHETTVRIDNHFNMRLIRRSEPGASTFISGGDSDFDTDGWVIPELERNLTICIQEKSGKIAPYREQIFRMVACPG